MYVLSMNPCAQVLTAASGAAPDADLFAECFAAEAHASTIAHVDRTFVAVHLTLYTHCYVPLFAGQNRRRGRLACRSNCGWRCRCWGRSRGLNAPPDAPPAAGLVTGLAWICDCKQLQVYTPMLRDAC